MPRAPAVHACFGARPVAEKRPVAAQRKRGWKTRGRSRPRSPPSRSRFRFVRRTLRLELARSVAAHGFRGLFVDANAVSPETTRRVAAIVEGAGARFVDGGIVGPPPGPGSSTRLYLSGEGGRRVAEVFEGTPLSTVVLDGPVGAASAVKMCYAAWTKGTTALILAVRAVAEAEGVEAALAEEWRISQPDLFRQVDRAVAQSRKAWRWIGEMEEIVATFAEAGLPDGFHLAAAEICRRLETFKDARGTTIDELVTALRATAAKKAVSAGG